MSTRIKDSQRQKMLIDYVKNGIVPDGFYVKTMKDGRVQFLLHKIELYKKKIKEAEEAIAVLQSGEVVSNSSEDSANE